MSAWRDAFTHLSAADAEVPLEPEDLDRLATAAYLIGRDYDAHAAWSRAYHEHADRGDVDRAAHSGFWLSTTLAARERDRPEPRLACPDRAAAGRSGPRLRRTWLPQGRSGVRHAQRRRRPGRPCHQHGGPRARRAIRRSRAHGVGSPRPGRGAHRARGPGRGRATARRGDGRGDRRRGVTDHGRDPVLRQRHRGEPGVRPASRPRVDDRTGPVVRIAARSRAIPRPVPGPPVRDQGAPRRVARGARGGAARL